MRKKPVSNSRRQRKSRRLGLKITAVLLAALICFLGVMFVNARISHLCPADVYLKDLPEAFDGVKILYISDINIRNSMDDDLTAGLFRKLSETGADLLILGGDYIADSTWSVLNGNSSTLNTADDFFQALKELDFPMGKYAVLGESDSADTAAWLSRAGVNCLQNGAATLTLNGEKMYIAGMTPTSGMVNWEKAATTFSKDDAVIAVAHDPGLYSGIRTGEVKGGGAWADLVLSGHNLGGQISLFGRTLFSHTDSQKQYFAGWYNTGDVPLLVSQGLGCRGVPLRLGSQSQIHLITLHRGAH